MIFFKKKTEERSTNKIDGPILIRDSNGQEGGVYICPHTNCIEYSMGNKEPDPVKCKHIFSTHIQNENTVVDDHILNKGLEYDMCDLYSD
ncbi:hypothetical protein HQ529_00355 [Candidatus Woesearchaeota archaeon]|nr:hypothetical protein [Candidatus Woesearchaeota archaeon]